MCVANELSWGEITRTAVQPDRRVLPFTTNGPQRRKSDGGAASCASEWQLESVTPLAKEDLPSSLRPAQLATTASEETTFRAPHRAIEVLVVATAVIVAVFTALTIPIAADADRHAGESEPVSVSSR